MSGVTSAIATAVGASAATASAIGTAGTIAGLLGSAVSAFGAIKSGEAAKASGEYNAEVATQNATIATQNANLAAQEGNAAVEQQQLKTRAEAGAIKTNQAAAGVDVNSGSAVDVRSSAAELGELSALNIRSNAVRQAYGYQTQAASDTGQAALDKSQGENAAVAGDIGAGSTILGGISSAASGYANFIGKNGLNSSSDITSSSVPSSSSGMLT